MTWGGSGPFLFDGAAAEIGFLPIEGITSPPGGFISAWCYNCNTVLGDGMKKNVAGQKIGAQLISATDGSAFTGSVSVYVTGDGGTQNAGGGTVTHEGNGYHGYAPTQAETNYDHIAFTFTGTGAIPATAQVFTDFPQTGDAYDRLGAPAGASVSADVAAVKTQTAAIETDTQDIQSRLPAALVSGRMDSSVGAMAANVMTAAAAASDLTTELQSGLATSSELSTVAGYIDTEIAAIKAKTDNLPADPADASDIAAAFGTVNTNISALNDLSEADIRNALGIASANLDTQLGALATSTALQTVDDNVDAVKAKTDQLTFTVAGQVDANAESMNGAEILGDGTSGNLWRGA